MKKEMYINIKQERNDDTYGTYYAKRISRKKYGN